MFPIANDLQKQELRGHKSAQAKHPVAGEAGETIDKIDRKIKNGASQQSQSVI